MTLRELSKRTGYSVSVLSRALNPRPDASCNISLSTRAKIQKLVEDMSFRPNRLASCMRRGKTPSIGVFLPSYSGSLITDAVFGISRASAERKLPLNFYFGGSADFYVFFEQMISNGCMGVIAGSNVIPDHDVRASALWDRYLDGGGKLVFFNEHPTPLPAGRDLQSYSILSYDDQSGGELAAAHLESLNCRNYVFLEIGTSHCYQRRRAGFEEYCQRRALRCRVLESSDVSCYGRQFRPEFFPLLDKVLEEYANEGTGIFVPSDYLLLELIRTFPTYETIH